MNSTTTPTEKQPQFLIQDQGHLTQMRVADIIEDPIFQMRTLGTNHAIVSRYTDVMVQNDPDGWGIFPRITCLDVNDFKDERFINAEKASESGICYVIGGFHRLAAMKIRGYDVVEVRLIKGTTADGIAFAAGENNDKSVKRTNQDLRAAVLACLRDPEIKTWTNPVIAHLCGCDVQTVRNWEIWLYQNEPGYTRPEKLKFRTKHATVGLREHSIPNFAVDTSDNPDAVANSDLLKQRAEIKSDYADIELYLVDPDAAKSQSRETDLLTRFPDLVLYKVLDTLEIEDLDKLETEVEDAVEFVRKELQNIRDEMRNIYYDEIYNGLLKQNYVRSSNEDAHMKHRRKALNARFPAMDFYDNESLYDVKDFSTMLSLREGLIEAKTYLEKNGYDEFMPEDYFKAKAALEEDKQAPQDRTALFDPFLSIQKQVKKNFESLLAAIFETDKKQLSWRLQDEGWTLFKTKYNEFRPKPLAIIKKMECEYEYDLKNKPEQFTAEFLSDATARWEQGLDLIQDLRISCAWLKNSQFSVDPDCRWSTDTEYRESVTKFFTEYRDSIHSHVSFVEVKCTGFGYQDLGESTVKAKIPLSIDEIQAIATAAIEGAKAEYTRIHAKRKMKDE